MNISSKKVAFAEIRHGNHILAVLVIQYYSLQCHLLRHYHTVKAAPPAINGNRSEMPCIMLQTKEMKMECHPLQKVLANLHF